MIVNTALHGSGLAGDLLSEGALVPRSAGDVVPMSQLEAFTDAWLANRRLSPHTRDAYRRDLRGWFVWCQTFGINPLDATFVHINAYSRLLEGTAIPATGKPLTAATVARKISGISSWYGFLVKIGKLAVNPTAAADRVYVNRDHSTTVGLSASEGDSFILAGRNDISPARVRNYAMAVLLADLGLRVGEAVGLDIEDLVPESGRRTIRFTGKGGVQRKRPLTSLATVVIDEYLQHRARLAGVPVEQLTGPLFVTSSGKRWPSNRVFDVVRRLAREAGVPAWSKISPHSLRHAFATRARDEGVPLEDVQDAMGHADPRTTRRYDRDRYCLDRDPANTLEIARARRGKVA